MQRDDEEGANVLARDEDISNEDEDFDIRIARRSAVADQPVVELFSPLVARRYPSIESPVPASYHVLGRLAIRTGDFETRSLLGQNDDVVEKRLKVRRGHVTSRESQVVLRRIRADDAD